MSLCFHTPATFSLRRFPSRCPILLPPSQSPVPAQTRRWHRIHLNCANSSNGHPLNAVSKPDAGKEEKMTVSDSDTTAGTTLSIVVVGASGDLAKKKIFPALFALYYENCLPEYFTVFGYSRSKMSDKELRTVISQTLTCRIDQRENCSDKMDKFLQRCFYHPGQYDSKQDFEELHSKLQKKEGGKLSNRLFYLSIPPNVFVEPG